VLAVRAFRPHWRSLAFRWLVPALTGPGLSDDSDGWAIGFIGDQGMKAEWGHSPGTIQVVSSCGNDATTGD
jgi:hypothetical protein